MIMQADRWHYRYDQTQFKLDAGLVLFITTRLSFFKDNSHHTASEGICGAMFASSAVVVLYQNIFGKYYMYLY